MWAPVRGNKMQTFEYNGQEWTHDNPNHWTFTMFLNDWGKNGWQVVDVRWSTPGRFADVTFMRAIPL